MKTTILLLFSAIFINNITAQNACACIYYDSNGVLVDCVSGNCSQARFTSCVNGGGTWFNGAGQVPAGMTACDVVLPVRLTKFTAFNIGTSNLVSWETASELNNDHYTLEKSIN
jgi:hypothetical protein